MPLENLKLELAAIQAERARLQRRRDVWAKLRADTAKEAEGVAAAISGKETKREGIAAAAKKATDALRDDVRKLREQIDALNLPNFIPEKGSVEKIEAQIREKELAIDALQHTSQGEQTTLRDEVEKLRKELTRLQTEVEGLRLVVEREDAGVTAFTAKETAKKQEITQAEHVVYDGPLFTYKPTHLPRIPVPRVRIVVDVENVREAGDPTSVITQLQAVTAAIVQGRRAAIESGLQDLDAGYGRFLNKDPAELEGHLDSLQLLVDTFDDELDSIEKNAIAKIGEVFTTWASSKQQNFVYKVKASLRIAWNAVKGAFAISRAVATSGADVTAYVQLAKAVVAIGREVKSLLGNVEEAWTDVEAHRAAVMDLASKGEAMRIAGTLVSQLLPLVKGSIGKLEDAAKVHEAKLGGVIKKAEELTGKLTELLDAQSKLPSNVGGAELIQRTQSAVAAATGATQLATHHRAAHAEVMAWISSFKAENDDAAKVALVAGGLKTAAPPVKTAIDALEGSMSFLEQLFALL